MSTGPTNPTPQFGTAEYVGTLGNDHCQFCHQPIAGTYYRVNAQMGCSACVDKMRGERAQDSHAGYVRGLAAGIAAAVLGLIGYAVISIILQGWVISLMSFAVGALVAAAMMKASNGVGGRKYQIAAALLTYAAVSGAAVPIGLYFAYHQKAPQTEQQKLEAEQRQLEEESGQRQRLPEEEGSLARIGTLSGRLALLGLASPFLQLRDDPLWGAMGLIILAAGIRTAWRIASGRPFELYGPFDVNQPRR